MLRHIDHVQLAMPAGGEDEARAFYGRLLGLPEVPKPPALAARGGCWFERDGLKVHLGVDPDFRPARKAHPAFVVDDLQSVVASLVAAGAAVEEAEPIDRIERAFAHDPFGNRLELIDGSAPTV